MLQNLEKEVAQDSTLGLPGATTHSWAPDFISGTAPESSSTCLFFHS